MAKSGSYKVMRYSINKLVKLLKKHSRVSDPAEIRAKVHHEYFEEYFGVTGVAAETILVEQPYVDRDYLEDFAGYYVRCFEEYERFCVRLHFFSASFSRSDFRALLLGRPCGLTLEELQAAYLGFIVIKNLPKTTIGRTCLVTYSRDAGGGKVRHYPATRPYEVNLFGIPLQLRNDKAGTLAPEQATT